MKIEDRKRMIMIIISIVILVLIGFIVFSGINNNNTHNGLIKSVKEFADKKRIDYSNKNVNATLDYGTVEGIATRGYVDSLVGDINTALDTINGEIV